MKAGARTTGGAREIDRFAGVDRQRVVVLLRSVVIATCGYLVLSGTDALRGPALFYLTAFAASNVALAFAPRPLFYQPHFGPGLLLFDSVVILFGMSWSHGLSADLLVAYFFTVFLITVGETVGQVAIGSALIAGVYGYWLWITGSASLVSAAWVRLPFFFLMAVFYAALIDQLKHERHRRREAENANRHLRFLLDLASVFSETHATREFVRGIGRFVEGTCPGLQCRMVLRDAETEPERGDAIFPLRAHGQEYGVLWVQSADRHALAGRERWLCQMVSHAAAGALYAAEQSDAARAAAAAKDQFLATLSHEFRTPLHAILGYLDVLDTSPSSADAVVREGVDRMRVNACRLQHLLEELLPITHELIEGKAVTIACELDPQVDDLCTDRRKLGRALTCLLNNAAKFTDAGEIRIRSRRAANGTVEVSIADTGIGIAASDLSVIFEDFRQADGSFTRRFGGLGIGLTLARELIDLLGGTLDLHSEVGVGTTVRVRLPDTPAGVPLPAAHALPELPLAPAPIDCSS
jgi:signal transduction histidine kinase